MSVHIRYPNLSGNNPMELLGQVKSYLHQLVEQLNWAFGAISGGDQVSMRGTTENGWGWRKWSSGDCECWGKFRYTASQGGEADGGLYITESFTTRLPFAVTGAVVCATADKGVPLLVEQTGNTAILRLLTTSAITKGEEITISFHIRGRS